MIKSHLLLLLVSLAVISACQPGMGSSAQPMPSVFPSSSTTAVPSPSSLPSVEPTSSTGPEPTPFPAEQLGKTYYTPKISCTGINSSDISKQMLGSPRDVAVSQDGKEIYFTFNTGFVESYNNGSYSYFFNRGSKQPSIERTYLYRIKLPEKPDPTVVNINQDFSFTCGFNGDIEMNSDKQLIITFPEMDNSVSPNNWGGVQDFQAPIKAHHFYQLNTESLHIQKFATQSLEPVLYSNSVWGTGSRKLLKLHVDVFTGDVYFYLDAFTKTQIIKWLREKNLFRPLLLLQKDFDFRTPLLPISAKNPDTVIFGANSYTGPFPQTIDSSSTRGIIETEHVHCPKIKKRGYVSINSNPKFDQQGNAFFTGQVFSYDRINPNYDIKSQASFIWKQTTDNQITCFAGNGKNGYLDGKGLEASFKKPSELDLDAAGNIYVADTGNHAIRKITPNGKVTTLYKVPENMM